MEISDRYTRLPRRILVGWSDVLEPAHDLGVVRWRRVLLGASNREHVWGRTATSGAFKTERRTFYHEVETIMVDVFDRAPRNFEELLAWPDRPSIRVKMFTESRAEMPRKAQPFVTRFEVDGIPSRVLESYARDDGWGCRFLASVPAPFAGKGVTEEVHVELQARNTGRPEGLFPLTWYPIDDYVGGRDELLNRLNP
jgi:hypothetical protein